MCYFEIYKISENKMKNVLGLGNEEKILPQGQWKLYQLQSILSFFFLKKNETLKDDLALGIEEKVLLTIRNTNVKYENSISYHSQVIANVLKFFMRDKETNRQ